MRNTILSLGDCNTLGVGACRNNAYPERLARLLNMGLRNDGMTMATVREGQNLFRDHYDDDTAFVSLQFGLVDSWLTFSFAPYVLYYPDNPLRKFFRKVVKNYKKVCRNSGLNHLLGTAPVTAPELFMHVLSEIVASCSPDTYVVLIETVPNHDDSRNPSIQRYNKLLQAVAEMNPRCRILETYAYFLTQMDRFYTDQTHINALGHEWIAARLFDLYRPFVLTPK